MSVKWDPFRDLMTLQENLNRIFDAAVSKHSHENGLSGWHPPSDVCEEGDSIHIFVEVAGLDPKNIDLKVEANRLIVRGERKRPVMNGAYHQTEILMGPFHRTFILPANVNPEKIVATYNQGILAIELPKISEPQKRIVNIKVS